MPLMLGPQAEDLLASLHAKFPCRTSQIRALATLVHPEAAPCRNIVLHGTEATCKSSIAEGLLSGLRDQFLDDRPSHDKPSLQYALMNCSQCITARHLFETTVGAVAEALDWQWAKGKPPRCESMSQLAAELSNMLNTKAQSESRSQAHLATRRFVLVFDSIDRQKEAPNTLLPALARLPEMIPSLTCVFILTAPAPGCLRTPFALYIHFPNYIKSELATILSLTPPASSDHLSEEDIAFLWPRFCNAVHDALISSACRTLPSHRRACEALWPRFVAPIIANTHGPREFSKLLIASRSHFQDESLLNPSIIAVTTTKPSDVSTPGQAKPTSATPQSSTRTGSADLAALLPTTARILLVAAYLASHNVARNDLTLFSTYHHARKRRGGGYSSRHGSTRSKHRKISRKLLGPHAFVLERLMAIFASVQSEWTGVYGIGSGGLDADVAMAISTLSSLKFLVKVGAAGDAMDRSGKWRINVGWDVVRGVGRSIGVEVEEWLVD